MATGLYAQPAKSERSYLLCGEFAQAGAGPPRWIAFATIKTDPYEQWLGGQAQALCERALPLAESPDDLSQALQARLAEAGR
jgi:hypothetical protein